MNFIVVELEIAATVLMVAAIVELISLAHTVLMKFKYGRAICHIIEKIINDEDKLTPRHHDEPHE